MTKTKQNTAWACKYFLRPYVNLPVNQKCHTDCTQCFPSRCQHEQIVSPHRPLLVIVGIASCKVHHHLPLVVHRERSTLLNTSFYMASAKSTGMRDHHIACPGITKTMRRHDANLSYRDDNRRCHQWPKLASWRFSFFSDCVHSSCLAVLCYGCRFMMTSSNGNISA